MATKRAINHGAERDGNLGESLKRIRKERGMTLIEAGEKSGMPMSTISKIENNKMSLSYDKLLRICTALDIDISELFSGAPAAEKTPPRASTGRRSINRRGTGYAIDTPNYSHLYPAADLLNKRSVPIFAQIHARSLAEFGEMIRHPGEEFAVVLEGTVDLYTDLYAPARLQTGDSIYFDSGMAHAYIAVGDAPCRILSVCTSDEPNSEVMFGSLADQPAAETAPAAEAPAAPARKKARK
ncbi:helix-turn-helix domain-containing protein [Duganella aceris]|jgi:transcriptional regulator with XRE-family HTH domain|uniref:Helix-turn-helix domain-containing protein n=1 Tax=Duganella aceris TaxID=2703883 RepID=A0ABX0FNX5_9BURK|nr:XRE family transcriptional regulator [Duganella aceris]NGZ86177.1 helix-turn-helix domain-containing protein [Duganella aceris]